MVVANIITRHALACLTASVVQVLSYREVVDGDSGSMVLLPRAKGNLHEFIANSDCAVSSPPTQRTTRGFPPVTRSELFTPFQPSIDFP